jgi:hypothetical protein
MYSAYQTTQDYETSIKELNKSAKNRSIYLIYKSDGHLVFATTKHDMEKHLSSKECDIIPGEYEGTELTSLYGFVLDALSLPFTLEHKGKIASKFYEIFVFHGKEDHISFVNFSFDEIDEATEHVEALVRRGVVADIETEVAILVAKPMDLAVVFRESGEYLVEHDIYGG